jgi:hypothetical protein
LDLETLRPLAEARMQQLEEELAALRKMFPAKGAGKKTTAGRTRRPLSASQKKAISERMKKMWATRRKAQKA